MSIDDIEPVADTPLPGLTSITLPQYEMGRWAVERLAVELAVEADSAPQKIQMLCPLVLRQSDGSPPRQCGDEQTHCTGTKATATAFMH